ncbi:MAG: hypothetical protein NW241_19205 [Bacteroidia bacterium]|nr:hypothetical protein [Bacteroidia bacterium]
MRSALAFFCWLLGCNLLWSQNQFFFDTPRTFNQVGRELYAWDYVEITRRERDRLILCDAYSTRYRYDFHYGWLYRVTMQRQFTSRKQGKKAVESILGYMDQISARRVPAPREAGLDTYLFIRKGKVYQLTLAALDGSRWELTLSMRDARHTPMPRWDAWDMQALRELQPPQRP